MYGLGTRSYNRSTEKRAMDQERKRVTLAYEVEPKHGVIIGPICNCRSFRLPHELSRHKELRSEHDWSIRQ